MKTAHQAMIDWLPRRMHLETREISEASFCAVLINSESPMIIETQSVLEAKLQMVEIFGDRVQWVKKEPYENQYSLHQSGIINNLTGKMIESYALGQAKVIKIDHQYAIIELVNKRFDEDTRYSLKTSDLQFTFHLSKSPAVIIPVNTDYTGVGLTYN